MRNKRHSTEQIVAALKQAEMGLPVADLVRQLRISEQTYCRWKRRFAGLESDQVRELDNSTTRTPAEKACRGAQPGQGGPAGRAVNKIPRPSLMKLVVDYVTRVHGYSQRKACLLTRQHCSTQRKLLTGIH